MTAPTAFTSPIPLSFTSQQYTSHSMCRLRIKRRYRHRQSQASALSDSASTDTPNSTPIVTPDATDQAATKPQVFLSSLANNTLVLQYSTTTLLIDPWLYDELVFLAPSFFRMRKPSEGYAAAADFDISAVSAIVLTQGLQDHAHTPTLTRLPKHLPVIAPNSALPLLRDLGFQNVTKLDFGQRVKPVDAMPELSITGVKGSLVGPPWSERQLGMIFEVKVGTLATRLYHEPHGNHDDKFLRSYKGKLDAVTAPLKSATIPLLGNFPVVNGIREALELCQLVRPDRCILFDNSGGDASGFLAKRLAGGGSEEEYRKKMGELDVQVEVAKVGKKVAVAA